MSDAIPESHKDLLSKTLFAHLATLGPDGAPQSNPVWFEFDGTHVVLNSSRGRLKDRNMRRDGRVALSILDPENPYRYLEVRGRVADVTEEGAVDHIHHMAKKYLGADKYPYLQEGEVRVVYKVAPERCTCFG